MKMEKVRVSYTKGGGMTPDEIKKLFAEWWEIRNYAGSDEKRACEEAYFAGMAMGLHVANVVVMKGQRP